MIIVHDDDTPVRHRATMPPVLNVPPLPDTIAGIAVPQDDVSAATWGWAHRSLPDYLLQHSIRAYCWGAAIGAGEGLPYDAHVMWTASLMHDIGLTRIPRNTRCFEVEGGEIARRFLVGHGMSTETAEVVATAIVLHMQLSVTLEDGAEAILLDRATGLDVRGVGFGLVDAVRPDVMRAYPRRAFDRHFLAAITREASVRPDCQSARLVHRVGIAESMARSPWAKDQTAS